MRKISNLELHRPSVEQFAQMKRLPVRVVLDNVRSAQNVGAFFRTCDAFAIEHIDLCGITPTPPSRDIHKTALGAELTVEWSHHPSTVECVEVLKQQGYTLLAIEQVEGAVMLDKLTIDPTKRYALIFGNEVAGVDQDVVNLCSGAIEIPQVGTKHSINVSVAGGVVLWPFFAELKTML